MKSVKMKKAPTRADAFFTEPLLSKKAMQKRCLYALRPFAASSLESVS